MTNVPCIAHSVGFPIPVVKLLTELLMHGLLAVVNLVAVFFVVDASHSSA